MKKSYLILASALFLTCHFKALAQSPTSLRRITKVKQASGSGNPEFSPINAWLTAGVQAGYSFNGGNFADNVQASGRAVIESLGDTSPNFGIPIMGNFTRLGTSNAEDETAKIKQLQQSAQGLGVGVYPYLVRGRKDTDDYYYLTFYGILAYKANAFKQATDGEYNYVNQGRFGAGIEFSGLPGKESKLPVTLSIEPTITVFKESEYEKVFAEKQSTLLGLETSLIVPAGVGRGILFNYNISNRGSSQFSVGLILVGSQTK